MLIGGQRLTVLTLRVHAIANPGSGHSGEHRKSNEFDRLGKKVRPGTLGKVKVGYVNENTQKVPRSKNMKFAVAPSVLTPFVPFRSAVIYIYIYIYIYIHTYNTILVYIYIYIYIYTSMYISQGLEGRSSSRAVGALFMVLLTAQSCITIRRRRIRIIIRRRRII